VGSLSVSQVLGTVSWGWTSRELVGPNGGLSVNLGYLPGQDLQGDLSGVQGLPAGWRLGVETGSPWRGIVTSARVTTPARAPRDIDVREISSDVLRVDFDSGLNSMLYEYLMLATAFAQSSPEPDDGS
jgi:hypothetical protein